MGTCSNCGAVGETQIHHVVPRSRGGSDRPENLVHLCLDCHGKAHDVSFRNEGGLVSTAIRTVKDREKIYAEYCEAGAEEGIFEIMSILFDADEDTHRVLLFLLERSVLTTGDLVLLFIEGKPLGNRSGRALWSVLEEAVDGACKAHAEMPV